MSTIVRVISCCRINIIDMNNNIYVQSARVKAFEDVFISSTENWNTRVQCILEFFLTSCFKKGDTFF